MANMSQNTRQTSSTFMMEGIESMRAFTTIWTQRCQYLNFNINISTFIPCQRDIALRGRSALRVLKDLKAVRLEFPSSAKLRTETWPGDGVSKKYASHDLTSTMMKSRQDQTLVKYFPNPKAIHLRTISSVKRTANISFRIFRIFFKSGLSSRYTSSKQRDTLKSCNY